MKTKLTLSIDADLMNEINKKAKLNKHINLSKIVETFLFNQFKARDSKSDSIITNMRGILKETPETLNWKQERINRVIKKHSND